MSGETLLVTLPRDLVRQAQQLVDSGSVRYRSLDDLVLGALERELGRVDASSPSPPAAWPARPETHGLLHAPDVAPARVPVTAAVQLETPLFILTNRLSPLKVAVRALLNLHRLVSRLGDERVWPTVRTFQTAAGQASRALGLELRQQDEMARRTGRHRRSIGYPVGRDERASLERFSASFTLTSSARVLSGPLVVLGLAAPVGPQRVALTATGVRLALAPSPLLDDDAGTGTLSAEEQAILLEGVSGAPGERREVARFLRSVVDSGGPLTAVDQLLAEAQPSWAPNRVLAHRAAITGRLDELGLITVSGRGQDGRVAVTPAGNTWLGAKPHEGEERP